MHTCTLAVKWQRNKRELSRFVCSESICEKEANRDGKAAARSLEFGRDANRFSSDEQADATLPKCLRKGFAVPPPASFSLLFPSTGRWTRRCASSGGRAVKAARNHPWKVRASAAARLAEARQSKAEGQLVRST